MLMQLVQRPKSLEEQKLLGLNRKIEYVKPTPADHLWLFQRQSTGHWCPHLEYCVSQPRLHIRGSGKS